MHIDDDENVKKSPEIVIGEDLEALSVDELKKRITLLKSEIDRIDSDIEKKQASKNAADKFFS